MFIVFTCIKLVEFRLEKRKERRNIKMSNSKEPTVAQKKLGNFAPKLVQLTDDVLFGDVWARKKLSPRDRSLITVASLLTGGNTEQLKSHLNLAKQNGLLEEELIEAMTHLAFYAGWPKAMSAMMVARDVFSQEK
ncbi:carboxymuconolactone decarboxylase family protein [Metabacillus halosaccharovorans]|uniref:carboxymuconolactone decarboxylase family protein n=2 Tax=Metabacillus halosaccharovorans TaxID=930124 RepID=UPI0027E2AE35|nr:carboxymuconolactone decarboxylase family protein [Metabacillus halosaccharovorans]